jgi:hypothetical protein
VHRGPRLASRPAKPASGRDRLSSDDVTGHAP